MRLWATIDAAFPRLFAHVDELGIEPVGPPFIRYLMTGERLEIELGVPIAQEAVDGADVISLPAGRAAVLRHVGPYDGLRASVGRLEQWLVEHGETPSGRFWASYVTDPTQEPDPSTWITGIYQPLQ